MPRLRGRGRTAPGGLVQRPQARREVREVVRNRRTRRCRGGRHTKPSPLYAPPWRSPLTRDRPTRATTAGRAYLDLRNLARRQHRPTNELQQSYALEGFLVRLTSSAHADDLVLKSGVLLAAYNTWRPTRDIDVHPAGMAGERTEILGIVREIAAIDADDGLVFYADTATAEIIRDEDAYSGVRVVLAASLTPARLTLRIEVNIGDPIVPAPRRSSTCPGYWAAPSAWAIPYRWSSRRRSSQRSSEAPSTPAGETSQTSTYSPVVTSIDLAGLCCALTTVATTARSNCPLPTSHWPVTPRRAAALVRLATQAVPRRPTALPVCRRRRRGDPFRRPSDHHR